MRETSGGGQQAGNTGEAGTGQLDTGAAGGQQSGESGTDSDRGYPASTPVADMTSAEQTAYWKHHARKHETAIKGLGLTPGNEVAELKALRDAQAELQKRRDAELSDTERLTKERDELAAKVTKLEIAQMQAAAAKDAGLPADLAQFVTARDAATAKQQAETLKARIGAGTASASSDQGNRRLNGTPSGAAAGLAEAQRRGYVKAPQTNS